VTQSHQFDFRISWYPYQLDPFIPDEGVDHHQHLARKFGSSEIVQQAYDRLHKVGKEAGINFAFDRIPKAINTFHLHRILMAVRDSGKQTALKNLFLEAFFEKGIDLTQTDTVKSLLMKLNFSEQQIEKLLDTTFFAEETSQTLENISRQGISGVPLFIINQKYGISGAQPTEVFLQTFAKTLIN
jgi:predicted DsbA family dithiol-disulfide isomerase